MHNDMEKARRRFIDLLIRYKSLKEEHDITVVFDAYKSGDKEEHITSEGGVKVIYTKLGETADDVIKRIISHERREWAVVTSDRDLIRHTWSVNSIPVSSDVFFDILHSGIAQHIEANINNIEDIKPLKGSPHRLSKKDRAIKRVLSKL